MRYSVKTDPRAQIPAGISNTLFLVLFVTYLHSSRVYCTGVSLSAYRRRSTSIDRTSGQVISVNRRTVNEMENSEPESKTVSSSWSLISSFHFLYSKFFPPSFSVDLRGLEIDAIFARYFAKRHESRTLVNVSNRSPLMQIKTVPVERR